MKGRKLALLLVVGSVLPFLAACGQNVQTYPSQCAYILQNGYFDARHLKTILHPGERKNYHNTTVRYVYCNARNYIVSSSNPLRDLDGFINAKTAPDKATGDGTPVDVELTAYWTLNQSDTVMQEFLPFCEKYNCFSPKDTSGNDNSDRSASHGWINMLDENWPNAIHRSVQRAMLKFPPNIWNDPSKWPEVADAVSEEFDSQIDIATQTNTPYFCGQGSTPSKCQPVKFSVEKIDPSDPKIRDVYNQQVQQQYTTQLAKEQAKTNTAQRSAAQNKYGPFTDYFLGLQDTIDKCNQNANCTVVLGNPNQISVNPRK